ncbi:uncharacterized protein LOC129753231 [Uranotaenia lowii]|uniref:uncharacterized protein LOC129753231 n=1 Tax=Uranotaenia lowii TaxID=190385 RepID=UPI0024792280|nr:uncharacterized protein LOC129753231 [Uranotaenia lowii]
MSTSDMDQDRYKQQLCSRRTTLLASLSRANMFIQDYEAERDMLEVALRLENLDVLQQNLEEVQTKLEDIEESDEGRVRNLGYRSKFEPLFFRIKAFLLSKLPPTTNLTNNLPQPSAGSSTLSGLKLPTISLPTFSGDYQDWLAFHDTFYALIHVNPEVSIIQKFHYLKSALQGEAGQLIESIGISAGNYNLAWDCLVKRYANEYLLKKRHIQALIECPTMKIESAATLHNVVDNFDRHVSVLGQLGEPVLEWSSILEHLLCNRLHGETLKAWEDYASTLEIPTYASLIEFLHRRMRVLESISVNQCHTQTSRPFSTNDHDRNLPINMSSNAALEMYQFKCYACEERHPLMKCFTFQRKPIAEKMKIVNDKRLCLNCFRSDHLARNCNSKFSCRICGSRHHTFIHEAFPNNPTHISYISRNNSNHQSNAAVHVSQTSAQSITSQIPTDSTHTTDTAPSSIQLSLPLHSRDKNVFMLTAVVLVVDRYGREHYCRALLDSASQPNIITERMAQILRLHRKKVNVMIHGVGENPQCASDTVFTQIRSRRENFEMDVEFLVLEKITSKLPARDIQITDWNLPKDIFMADPYFHKSAGIDMIVGNEHFFSCFKTGAKIFLSDSLPLLVDSAFGWLVSGAANIQHRVQPLEQFSVTMASLVSLEESLERFWSIEELPSRQIYSEEELACEKYFVETTSRAPDGRYVVRLPRSTHFEEMVGQSEDTAFRRFKALEHRLNSDPELKKEYHQFMKEYIDLGHMREITRKEASEIKGYFLPHHHVIKESSTTTKIRVVFDASAKTSYGYSLNDALLVGPVIQDELIASILRFRTYPVAIVADIEKMYRQILLHPHDSRFQRIFWRFSTQHPISIFELNTVTYGMGPSSFLATRCLSQLIEDEGHKYPLAALVAKKGFYMDDFMGGAQTVESAIQLTKQLNALMLKGGFVLRKYASNKLEVLQMLNDDQIGVSSRLRFDKNERIKTLGISWEPQTDMFASDIKLSCKHERITKRLILSGVAQLFDPLGLIAPIVIRGKMLLQNLWLQSCGWDDEVSNDVQLVWRNFVDELKLLSEYKIPRYAFLPDAIVQLHTFADASESAYGACIYARSMNAKGEISVHLLAAKSRVAPLKTVTLPRLELCSAQLGAKLHAKVAESLQTTISSSFFWSDSTVTLQWISSPPSSLKTFVGNRVSAIQNMTKPSQWHHVAGSQNPADYVSRGMDVPRFLSSTVWRQGPEWLSKPEEFWPHERIPDYPESGEERRKLLVAVASTELKHSQFFSLYYSYTHLKRITALCLRFIRNCRSKARTQPSGDASDVHLSPTVEELDIAEMVLVKLAQSEGFENEITLLKKGSYVPKQSPIRLLNPLVDEKGILRVGGRLKLADQPYVTRHPILLPNFHPLARMLAIHYHLKFIHGGGRLTLSNMRELFWPINGRRLVRSVIRGCWRCTRASPVPACQQVGQLPEPRVRPARPFTVTGVDYAGPLYLRPVHKRAGPSKAYISVFVCFATKAVHLELVSDLSTQRFLCAFRRFISRRGRPTDMYSDNGKNFEGANNELIQMLSWYQDETQGCIVQSAAADEGISWHWSPPRAPHFGGLWEAAVKVAKRHLYRQLGNIRLSFEDMVTVLTEIEAAMNSRPLVPMSEDPNDLSCLTPAHFLIGSTMHALQEPDLTSFPDNNLDHYQSLQKAVQQFWHHWRLEYLQELQRSTKYNAPNKEIVPGRLVVIVDEFQHPTKWQLGRITSIHPGPDQLTRVVSLKTARGFTKRAINQICLLPCDPMEYPDSTTTSAKNTTQEGERNNM